MTKIKINPIKANMSIQMSALIALFVFFSSFLSACVQNVTIPYRQEDHGSFEEEWASHRKVGGWWYATGILHDINDPDRLYAYQYTVFYFSPTIVHKIKQLALTMISGQYSTLIQLFSTSIDTYVYSLTLIDLQTGQHLNSFIPGVVSWDTYANKNTVSFQTLSKLIRGEDSLTLSARGTGMKFELELDMGKGAFWHADNGVLAMSCTNDPIARTVYYSYTNMPTTGSLTYTNEAGEKVNLQVEGQSWLDRQWGPMGLDSKPFWEWFSLRFFDDEEVMLFAFPQSGYQDATYIDAAGNTEIFSNYNYIPDEIWQDSFDNFFSWGWDLTMPGIKEEHYRIVPMVDKTFYEDFGLWLEIPAEIINDNDEVVGYAFVELIPHSRNDGPNPCLN